MFEPATIAANHFTERKAVPSFGNISFRVYPITFTYMKTIRKVGHDRLGNEYLKI